MKRFVWALCGLAVGLSLSTAYADGFSSWPAQGGSGGLSTVSTTGDGLSGDGSAGDPLAVAADLEEIVDDLSVSNQTFTGVSAHDMVFHPTGDGASASKKWQIKATPNGESLTTFFEVDPEEYVVSVQGGADLRIWAGYLRVVDSASGAEPWDSTLIEPSTGVGFQRKSGGSVVTVSAAQISPTLVNAADSGNAQTAYLDLAVKAGASVGPVTMLRLNGDTNVADVGTRTVVGGSAIGTNTWSLGGSSGKGSGFVRTIEANATSNTITAAEASAVGGYLFTDDGTDNGNTSNNTLPAAAAGLVVRFYCAYGDADDILKITAAGDDTIRIGSAVSAAAGNVQINTTGTSLVLECINGTEWVSMGGEGDVESVN